MNAANLSAAAAEMHVRINETREDALALRIDLFCCRAHPLRDFRIGTHGDDPASLDRYCFRLRVRMIHGPHATMHDCKISGSGLLRICASESEQQQSRRKKNTFHEVLHFRIKTSVEASAQR